MSTKLGLFCEKVIEAGWLMALVVTPLFLNVYSQRTFEPDKVTLLRSIALVMVLAGVIRLIDCSGVDNCKVQNVKRPIGLKYGLDIPLVRPTLLLGVAYLLSTFLSVSPRVSLWGSYSRLQGLFTTSSYLVFFFFILGMVRKQEQLDRLQGAIILVSLPIALYGILQHLHLDPMPWAGARAATVPQRVVSTFGNPIFLGAYLVMVIPVTLSRLLESYQSFSKGQKRGIFKSFGVVCLSLVAIVQFACLFFTQSRGPWLGLISALYVFVLLILLKHRREEASARRVSFREAAKALTFAFLSLPVGVLPAYVFLVATRRGRSWLWLSWVFHALLTIGFLFLLNFPETPLRPLRQIPYLSRLGEISQAQTGTGKVRMLIWQGTTELIRSDLLRTITGYGPETVRIIYPPYYPPELTRYEARNAAVDRLHNETFDVLVTTGVIGLTLYLAVIGSLLYHGLKWMGLIRTIKDKRLFISTSLLGALAGLVFPRWLEGTFRLCGLGLPLGLFTGSFGYLVLSGINLSAEEGPQKNLNQPWLAIGLFSALIGHLVEVQFGIAVASTRLHFWVYAASLVVIGQGLKQKELRDEESPAACRGMWNRFIRSPYLLGSLLLLAVLLILGFNFITNPMGDKNWLKILEVSLMTRGSPGSFESSCAVLWLFILTWLIGGFLAVYQSNPASCYGTLKERLFSSAICLGVPLFSFLFGMSVYSFFLQPSNNLANTIVFCYMGIGFIIFFMALSLLFRSPLPQTLYWKKAVWAYPIMAGLVFIIIFASNLRPIQADIYAKQGLMMKDGKLWDSSIQSYRHAISMAPDQENHYLELSRTLMDRADTLGDLKGKEALFRENAALLEQARKLHPKSPELYASLGHLYHRWADGVLDPTERKSKLDQSDLYFEQASQWAPKNVAILNRWAQVSLAKGDFEETLKRLERSRSLDPGFSSTYFQSGEVFSAQGRYEAAASFYQQAMTLNPRDGKARSAMGYLHYRKGELSKAEELILEGLRMDPNQPTARSILGFIYFRSGRLEQAMEENLKILRGMPEEFGSHKNLALIYQRMGRLDEAIFHAQRALGLSPERNHAAIQEFINQMKAQKDRNR